MKNQTKLIFSQQTDAFLNNGLTNNSRLEGFQSYICILTQHCTDFQQAPFEYYSLSSEQQYSSEQQIKRNCLHIVWNLQTCSENQKVKVTYDGNIPTEIRVTVVRFGNPGK